MLGFLGSASETDYATTTAALRRGLNEAGYVEKQNLLIEYRWADFQYERLPAPVEPPSLGGEDHRRHHAIGIKM